MLSKTIIVVAILIAPASSQAETKTIVSSYYKSSLAGKSWAKRLWGEHIKVLSNRMLLSKGRRRVVVNLAGNRNVLFLIPDEGK